MPYLSASEVVIHYEEALYQVYAPLPLLQLQQQLLLLLFLLNWPIFLEISPGWARSAED